ncbi:hypothetical protein CSUI_004417 [Cystoisospora suis]|uniref:Uncharacterized protein n=1 Tax=Cystoisospora suis TaxID=483139 RepID=A0A2C6L178_9APIC|nr:hypothetical protein CSUI_004417 [Cystoisospora suis]
MQRRLSSGIFKFERAEKYLLLIQPLPTTGRPVILREPLREKLSGLSVRYFVIQNWWRGSLIIVP